ncbi:hypothetical protein [Kribbella soli]|uniref:Uncharacterized protein n=1 Tax=Kribbella soli TaxID=1124743 RepID=A0A4R0HA74_9ACTN|nr:hypothetical protein [Kribbella soli]TCC07797.1 hypothetical protein E0H45_17765 [Kribbella soli]
MEQREPSYQVVVQGELMPAVLAFCADSPACHQMSGVFRVRVRDDQGIAGLVARLQAGGLMILSIRQVTPAAGLVSASGPA